MDKDEYRKEVLKELKELKEIRIDIRTNSILSLGIYILLIFIAIIVLFK